MKYVDPENVEEEQYSVYEQALKGAQALSLESGA